MDERERTMPDQPSLAGFERKQIQALFAFHKNVTDLLRNSELDNDKLTLVSQRIQLSLGDVTVQMVGTKNLNLEERLDLAYEELQCLVDELSAPHDCGGTGQTPTN